MERRTSFLTETRKIPLTLDSMDAYMSLFGLNDQNVALVEQECGVAVSLRGSELFLTGEAEDAGLAESVILKLLEMIRRGDLVDRTRIRYAIELASEGNADRIGEALTSLRNALDADETGVLAQLKNSENELNHIRSHYPAAGEYAGRLRSVLEELKDINGSAAAACERLDADPERLAKCSARLDTLIALQQKHRAADEAELIALRDRCAAQLAAIVHSDEEIAQAEAALSEAAEKTATLADRLHKTREKAAAGFEKHILSTLARLGMPETVFRIALTPLAEPGRTGRDSVQFLFTANPRMTPQPVERIASGGELSRVMLALKALLAERMQLPTIIFDEIDTGVSGRIADAMGEIIASLSASMQVVDITHLPQVASKGTAHFVVYKRGGRTDITRLGDEERVTEIAKMLSGSEITDAAVAQARILLGK